jgi:hypothetical protein
MLLNVSFFYISRSLTSSVPSYFNKNIKTSTGAIIGNDYNYEELVKVIILISV